MKLSTELSNTHLIYPIMDSLTGDFEITFKYKTLGIASCQFDLRQEPQRIKRMNYHLQKPTTYQNIRVVREDDNISCYVNETLINPQINNLNSNDVDVMLGFILYQNQTTNLLEVMVKYLKIKAL